MTIEELNLVPSVEAHARKLQARHPSVVFTSGRRTVGQQATAMARNVIQGGRHWIRDTYADSHAIRALQEWVNNHPNVNTVAGIAAGLVSIINGLPPAEQMHISRHLSGWAFDVKPRSCPLSALRALNPDKLLTREGNLERWHLQWDPE